MGATWIIWARLLVPSSRLEGSPQPSAAQWSVVVDMGCEPPDLQRVLRKANQHPQSLHAVKVSADQDEPCWRLLWGRFASGEEARAAIPNLPAGLRRQGFEPHPVELDVGLKEAPEGPPQER